MDDARLIQPAGGLLTNHKVDSLTDSIYVTFDEERGDVSAPTRR